MTRSHKIMIRFTFRTSLKYDRLSQVGLKIYHLVARRSVVLSVVFRDNTARRRI